jgi:hypothetical protein
MANKIRSLLIIVSGITEIITLHAWLVCKSFTGVFHHSSGDVNLQIQDYLGSERNTPLFVARLFHNKMLENIFDFFNFYLHFWDIRFGGNWFSLIGYFGICAGFYYFLSNKKKNVLHWLSIIVLLLLPLIEIFIEPHVSILIKSIYLWLPFTIFSLYGIYQFLQYGSFKKRISILIILIATSILFFISLNTSISPYCIR